MVAAGSTKSESGDVVEGTVIAGRPQVKVLPVSRGVLMTTITFQTTLDALLGLTILSCERDAESRSPRPVQRYDSTQLID